MAGPGVRHVFIRDMTLMADIGVCPHEHRGPQRVRVNVDLAVAERDDVADQLARVVDYGVVANRVRAIVAAGHVKLVETLVDRIASACLEDERILRVRIRVEKLDVFNDTFSVGVEVDRAR